MNTKDRQLTERYFQNNLSGIELEDFNRRLANDESFQKEVSKEEVLYHAVEAAWRQEQVGSILEQINYRRPLIPAGLKYILIFLFTVMGIVSLWFYTGRKTDMSKGIKPIVSFFKDDKNSIKPNPDKKSVSTPVQKVKRRSTDLDTMMSDSVVAQDGMADTLPEEVKQDVMNLSSSVVVTDIGPDIKRESTTSENAIQKLNPEAEVPVAEKKISEYTVEFWTSPVNYEGYKMVRNKIILFGIEFPEAVKLYRVNDVIYLGYRKAYYRLDNTLEFKPYQKLKEPEIPVLLKH